MGEVAWSAPTVAPVVGEWARMRNGRIIGPIHASESVNLPWGAASDHGSYAWQENGAWKFDRRAHKFDLIAVVSEPDCEPVKTEAEDPEVDCSPDVTTRVEKISVRCGQDAIDVSWDDNGDVRLSDWHGDWVAAPAAAARAVAHAILKLLGDEA